MPVMNLHDHKRARDLAYIPDILRYSGSRDAIMCVYRKETVRSNWFDDHEEWGHSSGNGNPKVTGIRLLVEGKCILGI